MFKITGVYENLNSFLVYIETTSKGYQILWLDLIKVISIITGIFVIITRNPILSVLYLIGLFGFIAVYLVLIGMIFIGLSYLLVYIGAISILFIFILMLINVRISELLSDSSNGIFLTIIVGISFNSTVDSVQINQINLDDICLSTNDKWDGNFFPITEIASIGNILYTSHGLWLIITSVVLLLAMVGTIVITVSQTGFIFNIISFFKNDIPKALRLNTQPVESGLVPGRGVEFKLILNKLRKGMKMGIPKPYLF